MKRTSKLRRTVSCFTFSLLLCLLFTNAFAQFVLQVVPVDKDPAFVQGLKLQSSFKTKEQLSKYVDQLPVLLQAKGYATASIDSLALDSNFTHLRIFFGEQYSWDSLQVNEPERKVLSSLLFTNEKKPLSLQQYEVFQEKMLDYLANRGYPFAKVFIDSIGIVNGHHLKGILKIDKGNFY
jgi:outer membrane protein assembly factor BamA